MERGGEGRGRGERRVERRGGGGRKGRGGCVVRLDEGSMEVSDGVNGRVMRREGRGVGIRK